jgi:hypothetical protein
MREKRVIEYLLVVWPKRKQAANAITGADRYIEVVDDSNRLIAAPPKSFLPTDSVARGGRGKAGSTPPVLRP